MKSHEVSTYITQFPVPIQMILNEIREIIFSIAPDAVENIAYGIPAYKYNGKPLVYFAGYKNHIGFYANPSGHEAFEKDLSKYKQGRGSVQFPLNEPIPFELIKRIIEYRLYLIGGVSS